MFLFSEEEAEEIPEILTADNPKGVVNNSLAPCLERESKLNVNSVA